MEDTEDPQRSSTDPENETEDVDDALDDELDEDIAAEAAQLVAEMEAEDDPDGWYNTGDDDDEVVDSRPTTAQRRAAPLLPDHSKKLDPEADDDSEDCDLGPTDAVTVEDMQDLKSN